MTQRDQPSPRSAYRYFTRISTRWNDNDVYGHINNVIYFEFFDSAINKFLIDHQALDIVNSTMIGLVASNRCSYFSSIRFPDIVEIGISVSHLGNSSVEYEIGVFKNKDEMSSAIGRFVHVYVEKATHKPGPIPASIRSLLNGIAKT